MNKRIDREVPETPQDPQTIKQQQYANAGKFNARIQLHAECATNKYPWPLWIFDQLEKRPNQKILELGCGTGLLWQVNGTRIPWDWEITVSDFSGGMLAQTRQNLQSLKTQFQYELVDAENIPFPENHFDIVIANHMLYHVPDLPKALSEISRVLKSDGTLYASTIGANNMRELKQLLYGFLQNHNYEAAVGSVEKNFSLDNGKDHLHQYFQDIRIVRYENALNITNPDLLVNYVTSCTGLKLGVEVLAENSVEKFRGYVENLINVNGRILVATESGMFICKQRG